MDSYSRSEPGVEVRRAQLADMDLAGLAAALREETAWPGVSGRFFSAVDLLRSLGGPAAAGLDRCGPREGR
jgi:hypothetical protein